MENKEKVELLIKILVRECKCNIFHDPWNNEKYTITFYKDWLDDKSDSFKSVYFTKDEKGKWTSDCPYEECPYHGEEIYYGDGKQFGCEECQKEAQESFIENKFCSSCKNHDLLFRDYPCAICRPETIYSFWEPRK